MYLCLCNGLKEDDVMAAAGHGRVSTNPKEVYARLGKSPQCGVCLCDARRLLCNRYDCERQGGGTAGA